MDFLGCWVENHQYGGKGESWGSYEANAIIQVRGAGGLKRGGSQGGGGKR